MAGRLKVLAFVAFLGFIAGIIADLSAEYVLHSLACGHVWEFAHFYFSDVF